jgi:catechol 2,3-dioxygenase-like lactoylglutathione lyase family enzyme
MLRFEDVAVVVSDAKKSAKWYHEKLGFEIRDQRGHWVTVRPRGSNVLLHLCTVNGPLEPGNTGIGFSVPDAEAEERELRAKGVEFTQPTKKEAWGTFAIFRDPDGNEFWITQA